MAHKNRLSALVLGSFAMLLVVRAGGVAAEEAQDHAAIRAAIEDAITSHLGAGSGGSAQVDVGAIDSRLRLAACASIDVSVPAANAAAMTVKVSCDTPSWTIYVPVRLHLWLDAVVAAANLPPNTALTAAQLTRGKVDAFGSNAGLLTDIREATGKILRVGLAAGAPILSPQLDWPIAVHRGQKVMLTLTDPEMTIKATAVALEDGRVGDSISVQNSESQKTVRATVARDGGVEINF
ncbi:MAG: flagellar basal body P-ring formation protein FlgA [Alphaproteobacteria bacterium]|nr:flagellar basal body P-ring formation protein FlgA [Alphaproteobacteria bacterium]